MKFKLSLTIALLLPCFVTAQNYPPITNPSATYTNTTQSNPAGTAALPGNDTSLIPTATQLLQQVYPPPPNQNQSSSQTGQSTASQQPQPQQPLKILPWSDENVKPIESWLPGLATIKNNKWIVTDYFYRLESEIGIKIDIVHPQGTTIHVSEMAVDRLIRGMFEEAKITPEAPKIHCQPPLPTLYVLIMAYPCERTCVGFVTMQLLEKGQPARVNLDLDGVWQIVTWARQGMVVSSCEEFAAEVTSQIKEMMDSFLTTYRFYHPGPPTRPCFPPSNY